MNLLRRILDALSIRKHRLECERLELEIEKLRHELRMATSRKPPPMTRRHPAGACDASGEHSADGQPRDSYLVTIPYREPTYELRRGGPPRVPYRTQYEIAAASAQEAIDLALRQFKKQAMDSGVGWVREIQHDGIRAETVRA